MRSINKDRSIDVANTPSVSKTTPGPAGPAGAPGPDGLDNLTASHLVKFNGTELVDSLIDQPADVLIINYARTLAAQNSVMRFDNSNETGVLTDTEQGFSFRQIQGGVWYDIGRIGFRLDGAFTGSGLRDTTFEVSIMRNEVFRKVIDVDNMSLLNFYSISSANLTADQVIAFGAENIYSYGHVGAYTGRAYSPFTYFTYLKTNGTAYSFNAKLYDGAIGVVGLADTDILTEWKNNDVNKLTLYGSGELVFGDIVTPIMKLWSDGTNGRILANLVNGASGAYSALVSGELYYCDVIPLGSKYVLLK